MSDEKHNHPEEPEEESSSTGTPEGQGGGSGSPSPEDALAQLGVQRKEKEEPEGETEVSREVLEDSNTRALSEALSSSFFFVKILVGVLVAGFLFSCVKTVEPNEVAIILRFGKPVGSGADQVKRPGLHWAFPYPIDEVVRIPVGESRSARSTKGWLNFTDEQLAAGDDPNAADIIPPGAHGYTLTSDLNIIHVRATLKYRISDPVRYVLAFRNSTNVVENLLDNAIFYASARFTAEDAIYKQRPAFQESVKNRFEKQIIDTELGIKPELMVVDARAPMYVKPRFDDVLNSEQLSAQGISQARSYLTSAVEDAKGRSNSVVLASISRSNEVVQAVAAEASYFKDQLPYYERNPELFEQRLKIASLHRVLTNAQDKFYLPTRPDGKERELRILMTPEPRKRGKMNQ